MTEKPDGELTHKENDAVTHGGQENHLYNRDVQAWVRKAAKRLRYAAEYDGAFWHGPEQRAHDARRRDWLIRTGDWIIDVFVGPDVSGREQDAHARLIQGVGRAIGDSVGGAGTGRPVLEEETGRRPAA